MSNVTTDVFQEQAAALVRRTRAGDQNAWATIYRVGEEARKGQPTARRAFAAIQNFIDTTPAEEFMLGGEPPIVMDTPAAQQQDAERSKQSLPRGALDDIYDTDVTARVIAGAWRFKHGMNAAALVLAGGPPLNAGLIAEIAQKAFQDPQSQRLYLYGVQYSSEEEWKQIAPRLDVANRLCLMIGQCVGRARKLQMLRSPKGNVSDYSSVAGWELGEKQ